MKLIYLAGPYGFTEIGRWGVSRIINALKEKYVIINPFENSPDLSKEIINLESELINKNIIASKIKKQLSEINYKIGLRNTEFIKKSDLILAVLDGSDADSGTSAEIGYAYGIGKKIYGYRTDFRYSGDNFGSKVNLQVEYFINASGGKIFNSLDELLEDNLDEDE